MRQNGPCIVAACRQAPAIFWKAKECGSLPEAATPSKLNHLRDDLPAPWARHICRNENRENVIRFVFVAPQPEAKADRAAYSGEIILINHITEVANLPGILAAGGVQSDYPDLNVKMPD